ncbi:hypothetical protein LguiB_023747 [Lonicera macranthoides]
MDQRKKQEEKGEELEGISKWDCGSPLYDSYELVTLSHHIDKHLMTLPNLGTTQVSDHASSVVPSATVSRLELGQGVGPKIMLDSKLKRWVLMLMRRACGTAEELGLRKWGLKKLIASSCGSTRALKYIIETGKVDTMLIELVILMGVTALHCCAAAAAAGGSDSALSIEAFAISASFCRRRRKLPSQFRHTAGRV